LSIEKEILIKFKDGDSAAFDAIYYKYSNRLLLFACGLLKDRYASSELVQEVFVKIWEKRDQVNVDLNFENYLITITYNSIRKYFRNKLLEIKVKDQLSQKLPLQTNHIENDLIYKELLEVANRSIEKLPPKRKTVYKLSRQEGLRIKEIACKLNISTRTVETHLAKAISFLKKEIDEKIFID